METGTVDEAEVLAAVDRYLGQPRTIAQRLGLVGASLATLAVVAVSVAVLVAWRPPWIASETDRLIARAEAAEARGDEVGAVRFFREALDRSPGSRRAAEGAICGTWSLGYVDDAAVALQQELRHHELEPHRDVDAACVLADPRRFGLSVVESAGRRLLIASHDPPSERTVELLAASEVTTSRAHALLVAACINIGADLLYLAGLQLSLAINERGYAPPVGRLATCLDPSVHELFERFEGTNGVPLFRPRDHAARRFVPGASPVHPATTIPLPPLG